MNFQCFWITNIQLFMKFIICAIIFNSSVLAEDLGTVVFVNILYRHGDRTPIHCYPNDPYNNESIWPAPFGQLTNLGKHQHLILGRWLRQTYSDFLPDAYSLYDIFIQSTDVDRTLESAEANLAGLYPPKHNQVWDSLQWMPIPVHTVPANEDSVLAAKKYCARYESELEKVLTGDEMKRINKEHRALYKYLTENTGKTVSCVKNVEHLYDTLFIESIYNKTLPEWTKSVYPDKLKPLAIESFRTKAFNKIMQRLQSGPLLGEMVDHMVKKSNNALSPNRKVWVYSAHDDTVANMLMTLGLFEPHCPPYAAVILIELRVNLKNEYFVTISYKNSTKEPILFTLPGCNSSCPLDQFVELTKGMIPEDLEKECSLDWEKYEYKINLETVVAILAFSVLSLIVLVFFIIGFIYYHYKKEHNQYYLRLSTDVM